MGWPTIIPLCIRDGCLEVRTSDKYGTCARHTDPRLAQADAAVASAEAKAKRARQENAERIERAEEDADRLYVALAVAKTELADLRAKLAEVTAERDGLRLRLAMYRKAATAWHRLARKYRGECGFNCTRDGHHQACAIHWPSARRVVLARAEKAEKERDQLKRDYAAVAEAAGIYYEADYRPREPGPVEAVVNGIESMQHQLNEHTDSRIPLSRASWHEDDGAVLWWRFPITEPPYVGTPLDDDFPDYVTHWTRIMLPIELPADEGGEAR